MVDAIPALTTDKAIAMFEKFGVFTKAELESREARAMINITNKTLIPAVIKDITALAQSINAVKAACDCDVSVQTELLQESSALLSDAKVALAKLEEVTDKGLTMGDGAARAAYYRDEVTTAMAELRAPIDKLEIIVDKKVWPMPSYGDLIFEV